MRTESSVRAGEKTDSSTSSTSISSAAPTSSYSSTTRSQMAYITADRAVLEHLGALLEVAAGVAEVDALRRAGR